MNLNNNIISNISQHQSPTNLSVFFSLFLIQFNHNLPRKLKKIKKSIFTPQTRRYYPRARGKI